MQGSRTSAEYTKRSHPILKNPLVDIGPHVTRAEEIRSFLGVLVDGALLDEEERERTLELKEEISLDNLYKSVTYFGLFTRAKLRLLGKQKP